MIRKRGRLRGVGIGVVGLGAVVVALAAGGALGARSEALEPRAAKASASTLVVASPKRAALGVSALPLAARSAVSATIGAESREFFARRSGGGYRLGGGGVSAHLDAQGVALRAGGVSVEMTVAGVGRGGRLERPGVRSVRAHANRVSLDRGGLTEWYEAGPLGIEQGFTISRRPVGRAGPVTLALQLEGGLRAHRAPPGTVFLTRPGRPGLSYGALSAIDATGRPVRSALDLRGGVLLIRVWDRDASYPLVIDPLIQQGNKLTGSGETGAGNFGIDVALSADGTTALIGAPADNDLVGAAWVFTRVGGVWTQQGAKLTGSGETGAARFGFSVALSADGNTALIGGLYDNDVGAAWVFTRSAGTWTQQGAKLTGSGEVGGGQFGESVSLSSDGNTALIGGYADNGAVGAAWVFTRSAGTWTQQGSKLTADDEIGAGYFGTGLALSTDGNTALIGGHNDNDGVGAVWVFTRSGGTWSQQGGKLSGGGEIGPGHFGFSVALSSDANTALIGGQHDSDGFGAAWVFTQSGGAWSQQGTKLTVSGEPGVGQLGWSVALQADGNTALIGRPFSGGTGAVFVFVRTGDAWSRQDKLIPSDAIGPFGDFGVSLAVSEDGDTALIGGDADHGGIGAAWVFVPAPATVPGAPTGVSAVRGNGQATVSFTPPASDGGAAISSYRVTASPGGATATGPSSPIVVPGLANGTAYTFTVAATNAVGTGAESAPSSPLPAATVPGAPTNVSAVRGNGQATVSFTPPASDGGAAISSYRVTASPGGATATGPSSPIVVPGLANGTAYTFTVAATNAVGTGAESAPSSPLPAATVPGAPTNVSAVRGNGQATVSFTAPASNGGAAISSYRVTASPGGATATGPSSPIVVPGLANGTVYAFTVAATNVIGTGAESAPSSPLPAATVPDAPSGVSAVRGNGQATVSFTAPASNGGAPISSYTVTASPGGATATGPSSPIVVPGLANGTVYAFTVAATNAVGTGAESAPSSPLPAATVPDAPSGVSAVRGNGQATVSFTAPASNGSAPISSYRVTASPGGATATGASSPIVVPGLVNGTVYTFTVAATNVIGTGAESAPSSPLPAATVPGAPTTVSAVRGNGQATVSFTAPASNGGMTIGSYTVTASPGSATATGSSSPIVVFGLANGTAYTFTVRATNAVGTGAASAPSSPVTPATVPGVPTGVSAVAGNGLASVSFNSPSNGGAPISSYTVTASPGGASSSGASSPIAVLGLNNGTAYTFTVRATNAVGPGPPSSASNAVTPALRIQQGPKLTGVGGFGYSVALSADGNTALIGAPGDNSGVGAARVYTRSGNTWTQQGAKLTGSGEIGAGQFGLSVALSADGNTALISAPFENDFLGAAWVYTRSGGIWTQQGAKLTGSETGPASFGASVALSADGNTALIGSPDGNGQVGEAWVFTRSGVTWSQQGAELVGSGSAGLAGIGSSVALSSDGNTALVGGYFDNDGVGAAWIFTRSGGTWSQQGAKLIGVGAPANGWFGWAGALSADGNTALIGGYPDQGTVGAAWVFTRSGATWSQQGAKLTGSGVTGDSEFGQAVALSADGNTALIGGFFDNDGVGAAWIFTRSGVTWSQQGPRLTGAGETGAGRFGGSVALSATGNIALIGGPFDNDGAGAAWVFIVPATLPGPPAGVAAVADDGLATVSWSAPASDGGSTVTGYVVTPFVGAVAQTPTLVGAVTFVTVTGLTNGTSYTFRVAATNAVGSGPATASNAVTPTSQTRTLPEPPAPAARPAVPDPPPAGIRPPPPGH